MADDTTLRRRKRPQQQTPSPPSSDLRPQEDALKKESQGGGVSFSTAFCLIFTARLVSAMINPIADCDETFNYWEPLHFLMYGHGMQTWEYDPTYALRSYLFLNFYRAFGAIGLTALASTPTAVLSFCCASGNKRGEGKKTATRQARTSSSLFLVSFFLQLGLVSLLNVSRAAAMVRYYGAPLKIYSMLSEHHALRKGRGGGGGGWGRGTNGRPSLVCVGKEWYRFPSHFILGHDDLRLAYLKSGFTGQLPQPFVEDAPLPRATSLRREGFNDLNNKTPIKERKEETSRYVEADMCSYIVDLELDGDDGIRYSSSGFSKKWEEIESLPFLDASQSPTYTRAFYVPVLSERMNTWAKYKLFAARNDGAK
eukprot:jgi/Bigna1/69697/fgenesh1_pg.9_\